MGKLPSAAFFVPKYAIRSAHSLLCDVTLAAMGRLRINTGNSGITHSVLYTPYFLPFAFSTLCIFYTQHSTYFTEPSSRYNFPHLSICSALKSTTETTKSFVQDLLEVFLEFTPNSLLVKDFYFGPKTRSTACTTDGREEMISCVLDYFRAPPTQVS